MVGPGFGFIGHVFARHQLDAALIRSHSSSLKRCFAHAGKPLALADDLGRHHLALVVSGFVLSHIGGAGKEGHGRPFMLFGQGMWVGAKDVIAQHFRVLPVPETSYVAASDVEIAWIDNELVMRLLVAQPDFRDFVSKLCMHEAIRYSQAVLQLKNACPMRRVVQGLAAFVEAFVRADPLIAGQSNGLDDVLHLNVSQSTLAQLFGVSRSALSPILGELKAAGWVELRYGNVSLRDPTSWITLSQRLQRSPASSSKMTVQSLHTLLECVPSACA